MLSPIDRKLDLKACNLNINPLFLVFCSCTLTVKKFWKCSQNYLSRHFLTNKTACFFISFCIGVCLLVVSPIVLLSKDDSFESCVFVRLKCVVQANRRIGNNIPL